MYELSKNDEIVAPDRIRIVGLGNAGCSIVSCIVGQWPALASSAVVNTDAQSLADSSAPFRLQIGKEITNGMGAGGNVQVGRRAGEDSVEMLQGLFADTDLVFLVAGLGGGTGSGAAPVVIKTAHEAGATVLCFAALPFQFEGKDRRALAEQALSELLEATDTVIVVPNDRLTEAALGDTSLKEALVEGDRTLSMGVYAVWKLVSQRGMLNLSFADLRNLAERSGGACTLGYGVGQGEDKAVAAAHAALICPMLGENALARAETLLVSIVGGSSLTLRETNEIMSVINSKARKDASVFMGTVADEDMQDDLLVTIVASSGWKASNGDQGASHTLFADDGKGDEPRKKPEPAQPDLGLATTGKGRFKNAEPTILAGEDLDVPTFVRRGIYVEK